MLRREPVFDGDRHRVVFEHPADQRRGSGEPVAHDHAAAVEMADPRARRAVVGPGQHGDGQLGAVPGGDGVVGAADRAVADLFFDTGKRQLPELRQPAGGHADRDPAVERRQDGGEFGVERRAWHSVGHRMLRKGHRPVRTRKSPARTGIRRGRLTATGGQPLSTSMSMPRD